MNIFRILRATWSKYRLKTFIKALNRRTYLLYVRTILRIELYDNIQTDVERILGILLIFQMNPIFIRTLYIIKPHSLQLKLTIILKS